MTGMKHMSPFSTIFLPGLLTIILNLMGSYSEIMPTEKVTNTTTANNVSQTISWNYIEDMWSPETYVFEFTDFLIININEFLDHF